MSGSSDSAEGEPCFTPPKEFSDPRNMVLKKRSEALKRRTRTNSVSTDSDQLEDKYLITHFEWVFRKK